MANDEKRDYYEDQSYVTSTAPSGSLMSFNMEHGYLEAIIRGFRSGFLREFEYRQLCQCDSLEDFKLCFGDTDFAACLQNIEGKLSTEIVLDRIWDKFVDEFEFVRSQAVGPLATFLNFIQYEYMITNISFLIVSLIKKGQPEQLIARCDPMGVFPRMKSILTFENSDDGLLELYRTVLIDTPIASYFEDFFNTERSVDKPFEELQRVFNEREISIITNMIKKLWLEDFYAYCMSIGGITASAMKELLDFEADRRAISIMINSFNTQLNDPFRRDSERRELFCSFGTLYPEAIESFSKVGDMAQLGSVLSNYGDIYRLWQQAEADGKDIEYVLYEYEVRLNRLAFEQQSHFACFWAFVKLKEQEKRNIYWISECITQNRKEQIHRWIKTF